MLPLLARQGSRHCDGLTRRELLRIGALGLGGLTLPRLLQLEAEAAVRRRPTGRARSVILLFLSGGPSQLDTFDPKPYAPAEIRGTFRPIPTNVPGIRICEHLSPSAPQADKFAIVRSVTHTTPDHPAATYWMMVGSPIGRSGPQAAVASREDRPHPGSALAMLLPAPPAVPPFVMVPEPIAPVGPERPGQHAGFLGEAYDPYRVNSDPNLADYSPGEVRPDHDLPPPRLAGRRGLLDRLARQAHRLEHTSLAGPPDPNYVRAFDLISSAAAQRAFDIA